MYITSIYALKSRPTTNLEELLIVTPDAISTHAQKIVTDGQISVIKICAMMYPTYPVYKLTPSLFFGFTTASAAIYIYLDSMDMVRQQVWN